MGSYTDPSIGADYPEGFPDGPTAQVLAARVLPDTLLLLDYISGQAALGGLSGIVSNMVEVITEARTALARGTLDTALAQACLAEHARLLALCAPVTPRTIEASRTMRAWPSMVSLGIVALLAIAACGLSAWENAIASRIDRLIASQNAAALSLATALPRLYQTAPSAGAPSVVRVQLEQFNEGNVALAAWQRRGQLPWREPTPDLPSRVDPGTDTVAAVQAALEQFQTIREVALLGTNGSRYVRLLLAYVLSGLFALLGSMTFGVRRDARGCCG